LLVASAGNVLYFIATDGQHGQEVWTASS
jgi:hypothetical protein